VTAFLLPAVMLTFPVRIGNKIFPESVTKTYHIPGAVNLFESLTERGGTGEMIASFQAIVDELVES
jgi:hypothetical protein